MYEHLIDTTEVNGFTVKIYNDPDAESPRDWTHGCDLALYHRRYDLPNDAGLDFDSFEGWADVADALTEHHGALVVAPVYGYDHGALALSLGNGYPFSDRWDSGTLGLAYVTEQNWKDTQGRPWTGSEQDQASARELMRSDVETYNMFLNGEVYGYVIEDPADGEHLDSLWGMFGYDYTEREAAEAANALEHEPKCNGELNRRSGQIEHSQRCPVHDGREG